jgi:hypothetical protein
MPTPQACGQATDYSKVQIKTTKVSGNIYMLEGFGYAFAAEILAVDLLHFSA